MGSKDSKAAKISRTLLSVALVAVLCTGIGYLGYADVFHIHKDLELEKSLVTQQAEYEADFKTEGVSFDEAKVVLDPYHASPLTALVMFETPEDTAVKVTVPGPTGDFTQTFDKTKSHFLPIYALMPDQENKVELCLEASGQCRELSIKTDKLPDSVMKPVEKPSYKEAAGNELYFFTPAAGGANVAAYDHDGNVRWYLTNRAAWDIDRLENGHFLLGTERIINTPYYTTGLYEIDMLGKIYNEWSLPGGYHHDYQEMPSGNFLVASNDFSEVNDTVEDYLVEIDRSNGDIVKKWNLKDVLPQDNTGNAGYSSADWFHDNAVWYDDETKSITLSGRHADAIVNIAYEDGKINWIVGDKAGWPEEYHKYFFTPEGDDFEWQWSQHASMITPEGDIFVLDNGNNKSKDKEKYVAAEDSYTRGVIYDIDTDKMTISQKWQYGKERGSEFYSPYISDVDYLDKGHYIVHSGGISSRDGKPSNLPAMPNRSDKMLSDTVELINDEVVFEMKLPSNFYRMEKMAPYHESDKDGLKLGKAKRMGSIGKTVIEEQQKHFPTGAMDINDDYKAHKVEFHNEEDRLVFKGTFKENSKVRIVLAQGRDLKYYKIRVTNKMHSAMCISIFNDEESKEGEDINVTRYINAEGLEGRYKIFLEIADQLYDTGQSVNF